MHNIYRFVLCVLFLATPFTQAQAQACTPFSFSPAWVYQREAVLQSTILEGFDLKVHALPRTTFTERWNFPLSYFVERQRIAAVPSVPAIETLFHPSATQQALIDDLNQKKLLPSEWYNQADGLPEPIRSFYAAQAALAIHESIVPEVANFERDRALELIDSILRSPAEKTAHVYVSASYLAGRLYQYKHIEATANRQILEAQYLLQRSQEFYALSRAFQQAGFADPQQLALQSYADQARLLLQSPPLENCDPSVETCTQPIPDATLQDATELAILSEKPDVIHTLLERIVQQPNALKAALQNPAMQDILVLYTAFAVQAPYTSSVQASENLLENAVADPLATQFLKALPEPILQQAEHPMALYLAHIAYRAQDFQRSLQWLGHNKTPESKWLEAKIATHMGKLDDAAHILESIMNHSNQEVPDGLSRLQASRIAAEQGVIALIQQQYSASLVFFLKAEQILGEASFPTCLDPASTTVLETPNSTSLPVAATSYWWAIAYLAESVFTQDELTLFVKEHANTIEAYQTTPAIGRLRWLLARRLMRDQQYSQALEYFTPPKTYEVALTPRMRSNHQAQLAIAEEARTYARRMVQSEQAWTRIGEAQHLFAAAQFLAADQFLNGMRLFAYELGPDYFVFQGKYAPQLAQLNELNKISPNEIERVSQHRSDQERFHYRYHAAALAAQAATLSPTTSQAYAASLCNAYRWSKRSPAIAKTYYQTYVANGPLVPWTFDSTQGCPLPDFAAARQQQLQKQWQSVRAPFQRGWDAMKGWL